MLRINFQDISFFLDWWLSEQVLSIENQQEFDSYYRSYKRNFSSYIRKHYANQVKDVEAILAQFDSTSVLLEVGCGCGTEALWFAAKGIQVLGIDLNASRLNVARERKRVLEEKFGLNIHAYFKSSNIFELETGVSKIDIIWMEHAFHHIEPRAELPRCLYELLNAGGYVVIAEVNGWNPLLHLQFFRQRGFRTIKNFTDQHGREYVYGDERITTPGALIKLFKRNGFALVSKRYYRIFPNFKSAGKFAWIENIIPQCFPIPFTHYNIILQKI